MPSPRFSSSTPGRLRGSRVAWLAAALPCVVLAGCAAVEDLAPRPSRADREAVASSAVVVSAEGGRTVREAAPVVPLPEASRPLRPVPSPRAVVQAGGQGRVSGPPGARDAYGWPERFSGGPAAASERPRF